MSEIKLCKDCKHNMPEYYFVDAIKAQKYAMCGRKLNRGIGILEEYCSVERDTPAWFLIFPTGRCGKRGRLWEAKE